jgi:hypothetical protein
VPDATVSRVYMSDFENVTMKHLVILAICFGIFMIYFESCKKDSSGKNPSISTSIIGTWELRKTSGGMMPGEKTYPQGNGNILKFTGTSYEAYENGQLADSGKYTISEDATVEENVCLEFPDNQYTHRIIYDSSSFYRKNFIQISNGKLSFISGCYALDGGYSSEYVRQEATTFNASHYSSTSLAFSGL